MIKHLAKWLTRIGEELRQSPALTVTVLLLVSAAIVPLTWFEPGQIIFRGDPYIALDPVRYWMERWSLWNGKINLGAEPSIGVVGLIHLFVQAIPVWLGGDDRLSEMWHFSLWFTLPGIGMAMLVRLLCDRLAISRWAMPIAVAFYLFNLYRIALFGDNNHFVVYAALPFMFYWVTQAIQPQANWRRAAAGFALTSLIAVQAGANPPQYLMLWLPLGLYGLILTLADRSNWREHLKFWLCAIALTLLVNLFWVIPFLQTIFRQSDLVAAGNLNWLADLSKHTSLERVIRLIGAWGWFDSWRGELYAPFATIYTEPFWWRLALVPALLSIIFLAFRRAWNRYTAAFLLIGLIGIVLAQGTHRPFGPVFEWLAGHAPYFWIFRSPWYKFTNLIAFSYAVLTGLGIGYLVSAWQKRRWLKLLSVAVVALGILLPFVIAHPLLTGRFWLTTKDVNNLAPDMIPYPTHIRQAADWLNAQPGETAVALLPYQGAANYRWGYASSIDPLHYFSRRPVFSRGDRIGYVAGETPGASVAFRVFVERLYSFDPAAVDVAKLLGIEYIVQRNDIKYEFYDDKDSPEFVHSRLAALPGLEYVKSYGPDRQGWDIYRLNGIAANPVFATTRVEISDGHPLDSLAATLASANEFQQTPAVLFSRPVKQPPAATVGLVHSRIKADRPAPALKTEQWLNRYRATGTGQDPFLLVLNQSFDPAWEIKASGAQIGDRVVANGYAPAWLVEPDGPFVITINYRPQRLVVPLALLSGLTALLLAVYLGRRSFLISNRK